MICGSMTRGIVTASGSPTKGCKKRGSKSACATRRPAWRGATRSSGTRCGVALVSLGSGLSKPLHAAKFRASDPVAQLVEQRTFNP